MKNYLSPLLALGLIACSTLDDDQASGIIITGTTISTGNESVQVKYVGSRTDTAQVFSLARSASNAPRPLRHEQMASSTSEEQLKYAWDFGTFDAKGQKASQGNVGYMEYQGDPKWASLAEGAVLSDDQTSLRTVLPADFRPDSLWIQSQFFATDSTVAQTLLSDGKSLQIDMDKGGMIVLRSTDAKGDWQSQNTKIKIKNSAWQHLDFKFTDDKIFVILNHQEIDSVSLVNLAGQRGLTWHWAKGINAQNFKAWLDFLSFGQWHGKIDTVIPVDTATSGTFTDSRDGQNYPWVKMGTQIWMAANLNYGAYHDASTGYLPLDAKYCPANDSNNCKTMGGLYAWNVAMNLPSSCDSSLCTSQISTPRHQGICPTGWHIPTKAEWETLATAIGGINNGNQLKSKNSGFANWDDDNTGTSRFNARPTGFIWSKAGQNFGSDALFWAVDEVDAQGNAYGFTLYSNNGTLTNNNGDWKVTGEAIRCVKD